jgi:Domain of unknown function (DUF4158)
VPTRFLTDELATYGRYAAGPLDQAVLERFFFLDDADRDLVAKRRGDHSRLGFALQLVTVRHVGAFLGDPLDVPPVVLDYVAAQIGVADPSCVKRYTERDKTRLEHQWEIAGVDGFASFASAEAGLVQWLDDEAWTTGDGGVAPGRQDAAARRDHAGGATGPLAARPPSGRGRAGCGPGLPAELLAGQRAGHAGAHIEDQPVTIGHHVVRRLCVLRPGPRQQAAPVRDLGHLQAARAARHRFRLAGRPAGLVPGGGRFPGARLTLHARLHPAGVAASRAARTAGSPGDGQLTGERPRAQSLNGTGAITGAVISPGRGRPRPQARCRSRGRGMIAVTRGARDAPGKDTTR